MSSVILKNLVKCFGKSTIIHGVNLEIKDTEFVVLVGPSGCGKSTILRMIAGLEEITGGEILIDNKVVNTLPPKDRNVAMVFQNYALYPHMNVYGNMAFGLTLRKTPQVEIKARVREAAEILNIEELLDRKPFQLSGGQRQRVAMGRAIVRKPSIFLFDEPLSNLDAKLRNQMRIEIKLLHQRVTSTIVYVTHDQIEAMTLGDRIVVLKDGIIEQVGDPIELFQKPVNTFVAGFIGYPPMNFFNAEIVLGKNGLEARLAEGLQIPVLEKPNCSFTPGQKVVAGLRTEDFIIDSGIQQFPDEWKMESIVEIVEPLGGETHIHLKIQGLKAAAQCDGRRIVHVGDRIKLAMNLNHLHLFDAETQKSIY
jgi:multiple sugar transport system ATP-binding protein